MPRLWTINRTGLSQYWAARLFTKKCTHLDIFLYEIPSEYSRKYTHLVTIEYREGGAKRLRTDGFVLVARSFVPPIQVKDLQAYLDRVDVTEPVRVNSRAQLERPKGYEVARWLKEYHHRYLLPQVVKITRLIKITDDNRTSVRFHYFHCADLDPAHRFANHWWRIGKGQGRKNAVQRENRPFPYAST